MNLKDYSTMIFDCDGVVLDSNSLKTEAFRVVSLPFGDGAADALVEYHIANGGVSRYKKLDKFIKDILPQYGTLNTQGITNPLLDDLLNSFARIVHEGLMNCQVADGLHQMRTAASNARWMIASGGDQAELREVFCTRELALLFDAGVFGSPLDKFSIIEEQLNRGNIQCPALFIGDSRLDHEVAQAFNFDFVFVSKWTEFSDWKDYCYKNNVKVVCDLVELI
jgi:phosphoglycolate phosphatase-like HAD superfamily hydrolase